MGIEDGEFSRKGKTADPALIETLFREIKILRASNEILTSGLCGLLMALESVFADKSLHLTGPARNQMKIWILMAQEKLGPHALFKQMESHLWKGLHADDVAVDAD